MVSGSAALPVSTLDRWRELTGHTLLERYGMTELGMVLSNTLRAAGARSRRRADARRRAAPRRRRAARRSRTVQPGELLVRGPQVFAGYWERPDATAEAFVDGWFRTGDVAVHETGGYRLLGRSSVDIIKTGGEKVSALEIEEVYRTHPGIADCAVVGLADEEWGQRVAVAIVAAPGADPRRRRAAGVGQAAARRGQGAVALRVRRRAPPQHPRQGRQARGRPAVRVTNTVTAMSFTEITYEVEGPAAIITMNRPERLNAFTGTMQQEMIEAFDMADADDAVRATIVTGAGRGVLRRGRPRGRRRHVQLRGPGLGAGRPGDRARATAVACSCCASSTARSR